MTIRIKKRIAAVLGVLALLAVLCIVHGMETFTISAAKGAALALSCELVGAFLLYKAGVVRI